MRRKIFITGAAGKTGTALLELMLDRGYMDTADMSCLCRGEACRARLSRFPVEVVEGDASSPDSLRRAYRGEDIVLHMSSIFHAPVILEACAEAKRLVAISSTGVFSSFRRTAAEIARCESLVESSGLAYTILRPTMIYGTPGDRNISRLVRLVAKSPIVPLPGGGKTRFQPVHVRDLARCVLACLDTDAGIGKSYNVPGGSAHSLGGIVRIISRLLNKRVLVLPVPLPVAAMAARALGSSIDPEQIERLREDKVFSYDDAAADFGYAPMAFEDGLRLQLEAMGFATVSG